MRLSHPSAETLNPRVHQSKFLPEVTKNNSYIHGQIGLDPKKKDYEGINDEGYDPYR